MIRAVLITITFLGTITDFLAFQPCRTNSNYVKIIEPTTAAQQVPEEEFGRSIELIGANDIEKAPSANI